MKQRTRSWFVILFIAFFSISHADIQDTYTKILPVKFDGFVKHESFWDTRQVVGSGDDERLIYPEPKKLDDNCCDINAQGQFDMSDIATRLTAKFDGPELKNGKLDGIIRVDFVGREGIINIIRMRLANLTLTWDEVILLAGQANMPFLIDKCKPHTVSRNTGRPIESYARYPQIQVTYKPSDYFNLVIAAMSQLDDASSGPIGKSTTYLRNALVPMFQLRLDGFVNDHFFGIGAGYKRIAPRIESLTGQKVREFISGGEFMAFIALNFEPVTVRTKLIFDQNASNVNMIGGYAVHSVDPINDQRDYTNFNTIGWWLDMDVTHFDNVTPGLFTGVVKNLGTSSSILQNVTDDDGIITDERIYGLGTDIDTVFRFSPRVKWDIKKFSFQAELEYTRAAYGTLNDCGDVIDTCPVGNTRLMVALYYYF